jgi:hypothetical protein
MINYLNKTRFLEQWWLFFGITFFFFTTSALSTTYYIAPTGSDSADGLSVTKPWATFAHSYTKLAPGDKLILMDGIYNQQIAPTISGTAGRPITFRAQHRGQAIIQMISDGNAILVYSTTSATRSYLIFNGLIARSHGEYSAIRVASDDNVTEAQMSHNITIKNTGAFGSARQTNTVVIDIGNNARDSLFEDVWAYGAGRKALQVFGCLRITIRRAVLRYDYWLGDSYKPNDPRNVFSGYNTQDSVYENIIAIDSAPTPSGRSADRSNFTSSGNANTALISGSSGNKYRGLLGLGGYGNGIEVNGGSGNPNHDNSFKDVILWNSQYYGLNIQGNDKGSAISYCTVGNSGLSGFRINESPATPITDVVLTNNFSTGNAGYGYYYPSSAIAQVADNSSTGNSNANLEPSYAPTMTYLVQPNMVIDHDRGARMAYRYVDGVLTSTPLWPWPNETLIKQHMCNNTDLASVNRVASNGTGWAPAWCASNKTLTRYIWEYLGNTTPTTIPTMESPYLYSGDE